MAQVENHEKGTETTNTALKENQVKLSDGRIAEMRDLNGLDELLITEIVSENKKLTTAVAFGTYVQQVSTYFAIGSIDGKEIQRPGSLKEVYAMASLFNSKDTLVLTKKYLSRNMGENPTAESNA